jgi:hypothetical protein
MDNYYDVQKANDEKVSMVVTFLNQRESMEEIYHALLIQGQCTPS